MIEEVKYVIVSNDDSRVLSGGKQVEKLLLDGYRIYKAHTTKVAVHYILAKWKPTPHVSAAADLAAAGEADERD
jgi:hypothetical protein